jgi:hypothetical protein
MHAQIHPCCTPRLTATGRPPRLLVSAVTPARGSRLGLQRCPKVLPLLYGSAFARGAVGALPSSGKLVPSISQSLITDPVQCSQASGCRSRRLVSHGPLHQRVGLIKQRAETSVARQLPYWSSMRHFGRPRIITEMNRRSQDAYYTISPVASGSTPSKLVQAPRGEPSPSTS